VEYANNPILKKQVESGAEFDVVIIVESFKKVLLAADSIAYTADGHSGTVFLRTLEKTGLSDALKPKLVPVVGRPATLTVAEGGAQYTAVQIACCQFARCCTNAGSGVS